MAGASNSKTLSANYGTYSLSVSWSESSPTVSTNKSYISASATLSSSNTAFDSGSDASAYLSHISVYWYDNNKHTNGTKIDGTDFRSCGISPYGSRSASGGIWVEHKDDGTLKGYCVTYFTNNNGGPYAPASNSCSTSEKSLETIARASKATATPNPITLSSASNTLTVTTNRKSTSFTHTLTVAIGSYTETQTGIGDSTTFDIPNSILADFDADSTTLAGSLTCVTYNGSTTIGTKTTTITAQIDTSQECPLISSVTLSDTNNASASIETSGTYIKYATDLSMTALLAVNGSYTQLASATVVCGTTSQTYELSGTSQTITFAYSKLDNDSITVYVTDARGTTVSQTETWTLIPYRDITVTGSVDRTTETGNVVSFNLTGNCFAGSFGNTENQITITYQYKKHNDTEYSDGQPSSFVFTPSGDGESTFDATYEIGNFTVDDETMFAYDQQYDFVFTVSDMFTSALTRELVLTKGIPVYGNGENFFAVYGNSYLHYDRDDPSKYWDINDGLNGILAHDGVKNLLPISAKTTTVNGITYTINADGTITANGTATADSVFDIGSATLSQGNYRINGSPSESTIDNYYMLLRLPSSGAVRLPVPVFADGYEWTANGTYSVAIYVVSGQTLSNVVFKPMIRDARIASDEFVINPLKALTNGILKYNSSGIWLRIQIGKILILLCTNASGGTLSFGVTFDSVPFVLTGAPQGSYGHGTVNQQIWDLTTSSMRWDAYYGSNTKYPASLMVIGLYSGQI